MDIAGAYLVETIPSYHISLAIFLLTERFCKVLYKIALRTNTFYMRHPVYQN